MYVTIMAVVVGVLRSRENLLFIFDMSLLMIMLVMVVTVVSIMTLVSDTTAHHGAAHIMVAILVMTRPVHVVLAVTVAVVIVPMRVMMA